MFGKEVEMETEFKRWSNKISSEKRQSVHNDILNELYKIKHGVKFLQRQWVDVKDSQQVAQFIKNNIYKIKR